MESSVLQYHLRNQMNTDQGYSFKGMRMIYLIVMKDFDGEKVISEKTLKNKLSEWSHVQDGWICKHGEGKKAVFHKRFIKRCPLSKYEYLRRVHEKLKRWM